MFNKVRELVQEKMLNGYVNSRVYTDRFEHEVYTHVFYFWPPVDPEDNVYMEKYNYWKSYAGESLFTLCQINEHLLQIPAHTTSSVVPRCHQ